MCLASPCGSGLFHCGFGARTDCIPEHWVCNGDNRDEDHLISHGQCTTEVIIKQYNNNDNNDINIITIIIIILI